jgi:hypothetical protein
MQTAELMAPGELAGEIGYKPSTLRDWKRIFRIPVIERGNTDLYPPDAAARRSGRLSVGA